MMAIKNYTPAIVFFISVVLLTAVQPLRSQSSGFFRVEGIVKNLTTREPLSDVSIKCKGRITDGVPSSDDGTFWIYAKASDMLEVSAVGFKPTIVELRGKRRVDIYLEEETYHLSEVEALADLISITPEKTEIEIVGDYARIVQTFPIPKSYIRPYTRIMIQPYIQDLMTNKVYFMKPLVEDGAKWDQVWNRMYNFNTENHPLSPYRVVSSIYDTKHFLVYEDSIRLEKGMSMSLISKAVVAVANRDKPIDKTGAKTLVLADKISNIMKWFVYDLSSNTIDYTTDYFLPTSEKQLCEDRGEIKLAFATNSALIDTTLGNNAIGLDSLKNKLVSLCNNPEASLQSYAFSATASPDGYYANNLSLAQERLRQIKQRVLSDIPPSTLSTLYDENSQGGRKTELRVAAWSELIPLLKKDTLMEMAAIVGEIVRQNKDLTIQGKKIRQLPFYPTLSEKYLPLLRRASYRFTYSLRRVLKDDEILSRFDQNEMLTQYEYWRLINSPLSESRYMEICNKALKQHRDFPFAANQLAVYLLKHDSVNMMVLAPYVYSNEKDPEFPILFNHTLMSLRAGRGAYRAAFTAISRLDKSNEDVASLYAKAAALNGNYKEAYPYYEKKGGVNRIVLLLAMRRNHQAFELLNTELKDTTAVNAYLHAIAYHRLSTGSSLEAANMQMTGEEWLTKALDMDPTLVDWMKADRDVERFDYVWKSREKASDIISLDGDMEAPKVNTTITE